MADLRRQKKGLPPKPKEEPKPIIKENKLKPFCNSTEPPKGYRKGTEEECIKKGQIGYYGLNKINTDTYDKIVNSDPNLINKKIQMYRNSIAFLKGQKSRLNKNIKSTITKPSGRKDFVIDTKKEKELRDDLERTINTTNEIYKEIRKLNEALKKIK